MTTNQIIEKAAALKSQEEEGKKEEKKRRGAWAQVGDPLVDKHSGIGVVISERVRGRPAFSWQIVHFDDHGGNKFVPFPCKGAQRPEEEIVYLLVKEARKIIEEKLAEAKKARGDRPRKDRRSKKGDGGKKGERRERQPQGLSALARADAQKHDNPEYVGKTQRKKNKGKK